MRTLVEDLQQPGVQGSQIYEQSVLEQGFTNGFGFGENHSCTNYNALSTHFTLSLFLTCRSLICVRHVWIGCGTQDVCMVCREAQDIMDIKFQELMLHQIKHLDKLSTNSARHPDFGKIEVGWSKLGGCLRVS